MQLVNMTHKREMPPIIEDSDALRHIAELKEELVCKGILEIELARRAKLKISSVKLYVRTKKLPGLTDYNRMTLVLGWKIVTAYSEKKKGGEANA